MKIPSPYFWLEMLLIEGAGETQDGKIAVCKSDPHYFF